MKHFFAVIRFIKQLCCTLLVSASLIVYVSVLCKAHDIMMSDYTI